MVSKIIEVKDIFEAIYKITFYLIIFLVVIYLIFFTYPRFFTFGHTEGKFDGFLDNYVIQLSNYIIGIQDEVPEAKAFIETYKTICPEAEQFETDTQKAKINNVTYLPMYILLFFYKDMRRKSISNFKNVFDIFKNKVNSDALKYIKTLYDPSYKTFYQLDEGAKTTYSNLYSSFSDLRQAIYNKGKSIRTELSNASKDNVTKAEVDILILDIMLNVYIDGRRCVGNSCGNDTDLYYPDKLNTIERMSIMRMSGGGIGKNWAIVGLYITDYADYIIKEKLVETWQHFVKDFMRWQEKLFGIFTSPAIGATIMMLPATFAGGTAEGFKNPYSEDLQEPFIDKIVKYCVSFVKLLETIANIVANPFKFILFLIGIVIAAILMILWLLFVLIAYPLTWLWAFIGRLFFNLYFTIILISVLLLYIIVYGLLGVIDMVTGGLLMKLLRCENLPDAWSKTPNWGRHNRYTRTFFCSSKCRERFFPSGIFCTKQPKEEPTFAPQQVIFQTWANKDYITSIKKKIFYSYRPGRSYFTSMSDDDRKDKWQEVYDNQTAYMSDQRGAFNIVDPMIRAMCIYYTDSNIESGLSDGAKAKMKNLCVSCYCGDPDPSIQNLSFCKNAVNDYLINTNEKTNIISLTIMIISIVIILCTIVLLLMHRLNVYDIKPSFPILHKF